MSMLISQADELRTLAGGLRKLYENGANLTRVQVAGLTTAVESMREAADTIESLRDRLQSVGETCSIEWRGESYDSDAGREQDGAYFCTKCRADLPYPLQEDWDDYQALVADYGNVPPWDKKPFRCCPNCGREVVDA